MADGVAERRERQRENFDQNRVRAAVHLCGKTASVTVSHRRRKRHASICCYWGAIFFQNGNRFWFVSRDEKGKKREEGEQIKVSYYKQRECNYTAEEEVVCLLLQLFWRAFLMLSHWVLNAVAFQRKWVHLSVKSNGLTLVNLPVFNS